MDDAGEQSGRKRRVAWVDTARVLGIFFVCQAHTAAAPGTLAASAGALYMFFVLAGYFNAGKSLKESLRRSLLFIAPYLFWSILEKGISHDGVDFSPGTMVDALVEPPFIMWFIQYLIVLLPLGSLISRLPQRIKLVLVAVLLVISLFAGENPGRELPAWMRVGCITCFPSYALFLYLLGDLLRVVPLPELPRRLFPVVWRHGRCAMLCSGLMLVAMVLASHHIAMNFHDSALLLGVAWLLLFFSHAMSSRFPRLAAYVAAAGPAVFLVYMCNALVIRIFTSAYIHCFGGYPCAALCNLFCAGVIAACAVAFRSLAGRYRVLDAVLFAR